MTFKNLSFFSKFCLSFLIFNLLLRSLVRTMSSKRSSFSRIGFASTTYSKQTYCGQDLPPDGVSMDALTVVFQTDKWIEKRGFRITFKLDGKETNYDNKEYK